MIIDHIGLAVSNYERGKQFFTQGTGTPRHPIGHGSAGLGRTRQRR
jgi:hypothetical protein